MANTACRLNARKSDKVFDQRLIKNSCFGFTLNSDQPRFWLDLGLVLPVLEPLGGTRRCLEPGLGKRYPLLQPANSSRISRKRPRQSENHAPQKGRQSIRSKSERNPQVDCTLDTERSRLHLDLRLVLERPSLYLDFPLAIHANTESMIFTWRQQAVGEDDSCLAGSL